MHSQAQMSVEAKVEGFLAGQPIPTFRDERLRMELTCRMRGYNRASVQLTTAAFLVDPRRADDLDAGYRYRGACCALLAASGQDVQTPPPDESSRRQHLEIAYGWIRLDLAKWKLRDGERDKRAARETLTRWKANSALATSRDPSFMKTMTPEMRNKWTAFWVEVDAVLAQASAGDGELKSK